MCCPHSCQPSTRLIGLTPALSFGAAAPAIFGKICRWQCCHGFLAVLFPGALNSRLPSCVARHYYLRSREENAWCSAVETLSLTGSCIRHVIGFVPPPAHSCSLPPKQLTNPALLLPSICFRQCPMCRAACHGGAGDCGTNLAMVSIIMSQFSRQYEERQKEVGRRARRGSRHHTTATFCVRL